MDPQGYLSLVLHAHLPYVRHPEHPEFLEERWFFEAITECYLPLLTVFGHLVREGIDFRVAVGLTPTLVSMLQDDLLRERYGVYLDRLIRLAEREAERLSHHELGPTADFYRSRLRGLRQNFERLDGDLVGAFRSLQDGGRIELIGSAATHAYLPHLRASRGAVEAQIGVGVECYTRAFGRPPAGFWLPECAFYPGLDRHLAGAGIAYTFLESHGILRGSRRPRFGVFAPVVTPSGVAVFARDPEISRLVWSSEVGYPGDPEYCDFYRDVGHFLPPDALGDAAGPDGIRVPVGLRFHRITGRTPEKKPYVRERALARVEAHSDDFLDNLAWRAGPYRAQMGRRPVFVAPYDAELFGHWWFEGPEWIDRVLRKMAAMPDRLTTVTPSEYLAEYPRSQLSVPAESSWGHGGYHHIWLNETNDELFPALLAAAPKMEELARRHAGARGALAYALDLAGRQLFLAQSSDWSFMQRLGTTVEYARKRVTEHLQRFQEIVGWIETGAFDRSGGVDDLPGDIAAGLRAIEKQDRIFDWMSYEVFARDGASARPRRRAAAAAAAHDELDDAPRVVFLTAEAAPYAKAGGLGDVCGALPGALAELGWQVQVVLPAYQSIDRERYGVRPFLEGVEVWFAGRTVPFDVLEVTEAGPGVEVLLVDCPRYFDRPGIYVDPDTRTEYADTAARFLFFCRACLETLRVLDRPVDVLHCHDHQTAMALALRRLEYRSYPVFEGTAGILTLHNLGYQGVFAPEVLDMVGVDRGWFYPASPFEYYGQVNLMKVGVVLADKVNAVSETYAREIREDTIAGAGLEGVLRERGDDLVGILNGIDTEEWNPGTDRLLPARFSAADLSGKRAVKKALLEECGIDLAHVDPVPLVAMITRLVDQKGLDLLERGFDAVMALGVDIVILGTGLPKYHDLLAEAARRYAGRMGLFLKFDNGLAHRIEGGADLFLMPSLYEPCGLNQMYSLRYGTVPVVRATGGLADTVRDDDANPGNGVGFVFHEYTDEAMVDALARAVAAYREPKRWQGIVERAMAEDHSWQASARAYIDLYESALERRRATEGVGAR